MTPKEASKYIRSDISGFASDENYFRAHYMAISALKKADKYRWHDLRKDPNDLPEIDPDLLPISKRVYFSTKDDAYTGTYDHLLETWDSDGLEGFAVSEVVIAWREIEPFEG